MTRYIRSPFLVLSWDTAGRAVVTETNRFRQMRLSESIVDLLVRLSRPMTVEEIAESLDRRYPVGLLARILSHLHAAGAVLDDHEAEGEQLPPDWTLFELATQRQAAFGGKRSTVLEPTAPPAFKHMEGKESVCLPRMEVDSQESLATVLGRRRSIRTYADRPVTRDELATFLYSSARVQEVVGSPDNQRSLRPYPGGGGRHTLELYLLCTDVVGLRPAVYYYHPLEHALYVVRECDEHARRILVTVKAGAGGKLNRDPSVVIHITSVVGRMMWKYERLALATIYRDVGCLYQTMYLVGTAMNLAPCALAGIQDQANAAWLGLDPLQEAQVGCFLLGVRAA